MHREFKSRRQSLLVAGFSLAKGLLGVESPRVFRFRSPL
jgi:hypothetical protein